MKVKVYSEYAPKAEKTFDLHGQEMKEWLTEAAITFTEKHGCSSVGSWAWKYIGYGIQVYFVPRNKPGHGLVLATITPYYDLSRDEVAKLQQYFHYSFTMPNPKYRIKARRPIRGEISPYKKSIFGKGNEGIVVDAKNLGEAIDQVALQYDFANTNSLVGEEADDDDKQHVFRAFGFNPDADWQGLYRDVMHKGRQTHDQRTVASTLDISPLAAALEKNVLSDGFTRQIGRDLSAEYKFWDALSMWLDVASSGGFDAEDDYFYLKKTAEWYLQEEPGIPKRRKPAQSEKVLRAKELIPLEEALMSGEREIQCPHCGMTYEMELDAGETMECWECGEKFRFSPLL